MSEQVPTRVRVQHPGGGESRTKQSMAAETDVNTIMSRWVAHGVVPVTGQEPRYGDFSDAPGYHEGLSRIRAAERDFQALPASVRKACENDPGKFLDLVSDPERRAELLALGLVQERVPMAVRVTNPPPAASPAAPAGGSPPPSEPSS